MESIEAVFKVKLDAEHGVLRGLEIEEQRGFATEIGVSVAAIDKTIVAFSVE